MAQQDRETDPRPPPPPPVDVTVNQHPKEEGGQGTAAVAVALQGFEGLPAQTARDYFLPDGSVNPNAPGGGTLPYTRNPVNFNATGSVEQIMAGIGSVESGGMRRNTVDYGAVGPLCRSHATHPEFGRYNGRALGAWQVMAENVGPWAREAGITNLDGSPVTPDQFMNPNGGDFMVNGQRQHLSREQLQQMVVRHQIEKLVQRGYGPADIASIWFTGRPLSQARYNSDGYNTAEQYAGKVIRMMPDQGAPAAPVVASTDPRTPQPPRDGRPRRDPALRDITSRQAANDDHRPNTGVSRNRGTAVASVAPSGITPSFRPDMGGFGAA